MTIREKMKAGHLYIDLGEGLDEERERCKELTYEYNLTGPREAERRRDLLKQLLGSCGNSIWIEPPVHMAYGKHVHIGDGFYANFNLVLVDDVDIYIGNNVMRSQRDDFAHRASSASRSAQRRNAVFRSC